ncbi:MAG: tetratricopeptide repeat protein [Bacteroidia bacterium]
MKGNLTIFNTIVLVFGIALTVGLTQAGCNSATSEVAENHDGHDHGAETTTESEQPPIRVSDVALAPDADLEIEVDNALANISKGKETNDMSLVMNAGIMKLLAVSRADTNNLRAIYHLGLFSIESGQLEKAEKRFEKLILLQPENKEYKAKLTEIRNKLK